MTGVCPHSRQGLAVGSRQSSWYTSQSLWMAEQPGRGDPPHQGRSRAQHASPAHGLEPTSMGSRGDQRPLGPELFSGPSESEARLLQVRSRPAACRLEQWGRDLSPSLAVLSSQERSKQWVQVGPSCPQQSLQVGGRKSGPTPASSQSRRWQQLLSASQQGSWAVLPGRGPLARPPPLRLRGLEVTGLGSSLESFVSPWPLKGQSQASMAFLFVLLCFVHVFSLVLLNFIWRGAFLRFLLLVVHL